MKYISLLIMLVSCSSQPSKFKFDYGSIVNNEYINDFFSVSFPIPEGWVVQSREEVEKMNQQGSKLMGGDGTVNEVNSVNLLSVFKYELGTKVAFNPSFQVLVENVNHYPEVKRGKDFLNYFKKVMLKATVEFVFEKDLYSEEVGGKTYDVMEAIMIYDGIKIYQKYYSIIIKGYAFNLIITSGDKNQEAELVKILSAFK